MIQQDITPKMIKQADKDIYLICNGHERKGMSCLAYKLTQDKILKEIFHG